MQPVGTFYEGNVISSNNTFVSSVAHAQFCEIFNNTFFTEHFWATAYEGGLKKINAYFYYY